MQGGKMRRRGEATRLGGEARWQCGKERWRGEVARQGGKERWRGKEAKLGDEASIRSWSALSQMSDTTHQAHRCGTGRGEGPEPTGEMINDPVNYAFRHLHLVPKERPGTSVFCSTQTLHRANREPLDRHAFPAAIL